MFQFDPKKEFSYVGKFWYPETPDKQFSGVLNYTQDKGLSLKILISIDFALMEEQNIQGKTIHGFVEQIKEITLLKCLFINKGFKNLLQTKEYSIFFAVLGKHCDKNDKIFTGIVFHFPEIDSFCKTNADEYFVDDKKPIINCKLSNNQHIKIHQGSRDEIDLNLVLSKDMQIKLIPFLKRYNRIVSDKTLNKKSKMTKRDETILKNVHKEKSRLKITKPFFCVDITGNKNTIEYYIGEKSEIMKMFSLFSLQAIYCDFIKIRAGNESYTIIEQVGERCSTKKLMMSNMPITIHDININFATIFDRWNNLPSEVLNILFDDKLYNKANPGYQQYSIMIAILGSWQVQNGKTKDNGTRYEKLLEENLLPSDLINDEITAKLKAILGIEKPLDKIARDLGEIRDCILHMDTIPKTHRKYIQHKTILENETHINNLCEILFIFMVKIVYSYIGIVLSDNQKKILARQIISWSEY